MMLRSSSTPVLGSLLSSSSYSESTNHEKNKNNPSSGLLKKISSTHGGSTNSINFNSFSCSKGFRRAQSDGNLEGLAAASCGSDILEFGYFSSNNSSFKSVKRISSMLQSIPSLSIYNSKGGFEEDEIENENEGFLQRSVTIGETIMSMGSGEFTFGEKMNLIEEKEEDKFQYLCQENDMNPSLFLARGLGLDVNGGGGSGGSGGFNFAKFGEGNEEEIGEYYKKMVEENPCSSLFLRNYAQFLYKARGDLKGADEYYSRAILADPRDGDILSQYARLVWELHHDYEKACNYFQRAVQAAPDDSHGHAAYASFLWEAEDCEEEENQQSSLSHNLAGTASFIGGALASATT